MSRVRPRDRIELSKKQRHASLGVMNDRLCIASGGEFTSVLSTTDLTACDKTSYGCDGGFPDKSVESLHCLPLCRARRAGVFVCVVMSACLCVPLSFCLELYLSVSLSPCLPVSVSFRVCVAVLVYVCHKFTVCHCVPSMCVFDQFKAISELLSLMTNIPLR